MRTKNPGVCMGLCVLVMGSWGAAVALAGQGERLAHPSDAIHSEEPATARADRDIIIVHRDKRWAYFGMYNVSEMGDRGLILLRATIAWTLPYRIDPRRAKVWLATFNGTLDPKFPEERDGIAVYELLQSEFRIPAGNITVADQSSIETGDFSDQTIVIYAWTAPRDAQNVVDQDKRFITFCAAQTDELGIGTGVTTMQDRRDSAYVVNANPLYPTGGRTYGVFFLEQPLGMEATARIGEGIALIAADDRGDSGACCSLDGECTITLEADCRRLECLRGLAHCDLDVDLDGLVNPIDAGLAQAAFGSTDERDLCTFDIDCDGQINPVDAGIIQAAFGTCNRPRPLCGPTFFGLGTTCDEGPCEP